MESLNSPPQPTPTQEEADALKEGEPAGEPPPQAREGETAQQRREREQKEREEKEREAKAKQQAEHRDVKPEQSRSGYQTR